MGAQGLEQTEGLGIKGFRGNASDLSSGVPKIWIKNQP